jgi:hypothetical protein
MNTENRLIGGERIAPRTAAQARTLIGRHVEYLRNRDIDRSGRGYYFPQSGVVNSVRGRNIEIDGNWVHFSELAEMRAVA